VANVASTVVPAFVAVQPGRPISLLSPFFRMSPPAFLPPFTRFVTQHFCSRFVVSVAFRSNLC
jgi:hypothetical protein